MKEQLSKRTPQQQEEQYFQYRQDAMKLHDYQQAARKDAIQRGVYQEDMRIHPNGTYSIDEVVLNEDYKAEVITHTYTVGKDLPVKKPSLNEVAQRLNQ